MSLKKLEANFGLFIKETDVDFETKFLTQAQKDLIIKYNGNDVDATLELFKIVPEIKASFESKITLITEFGLDLHYLGKTDAQIAAKTMGAVKQHHEMEIIDPEIVKANYRVVPDQPVLDKDFLPNPPNLKLGKYAKLLDEFQ